MGLIQYPDLPEKIRRAFGIREAGVGATLSPELVGVVLVDDLTGPTISEGYPRLVMGRSAGGSSAGVYGEAIVWNPVDSNVDLLVVEAQVLSNTANATHHIRTSPVPPTGHNPQATVQWCDRRVPGLPATGVGGRNNAAWYGTLFTYISLAANVPLTLPLNITLPPGHGLSFATAAYLQSMYVTWWVEERLRRT